MDNKDQAEIISIINSASDPDDMFAKLLEKKLLKDDHDSIDSMVKFFATDKKISRAFKIWVSKFNSKLYNKSLELKMKDIVMIYIQKYFEVITNTETFKLEMIVSKDGELVNPHNKKKGGKK